MARDHFVEQSSRGPRDLVHDSDGGHPRCSRERIEVDDQDLLTHLYERLAPVAVLERYQNHIGAADTIRAAEGTGTFQTLDSSIRVFT